MLILSEYWTPKTVVNNPSEFNIHRKVESKPKAINIPCLKKQIAGAGSLDIQTCKNYWELVTSNFELKFLLNFLDIWKKVIKKETSDLDKRKKYEKSYTLAGKSVPRKKGEREGCLLFWLKTYSIIGSFNSKLVWRQVPKLEFCWVFFSVFFTLLYSHSKFLFES